MRINEDAPVVARAQVLVAADPPAVWQVLTDLERWPDWKPEVRSVALQGALAPGSVFVWRVGPGTIRSTLHDVDPARRIAWTGSTFGIKAVDVFTFEPRGGATLVREEESWEGLIVRLFSGRFGRTLQSSLDSGLAQLKAEVERRHPLSLRLEERAAS